MNLSTGLDVVPLSTFLPLADIHFSKSGKHLFNKKIADTSPLISVKGPG